MECEKTYIDISGLKSAIFAMKHAIISLEKEINAITKDCYDDKIPVIRNIVPDEEFIKKLERCVKSPRTFSQKQISESIMSQVKSGKKLTLKQVNAIDKVYESVLNYEKEKIIKKKRGRKKKEVQKEPPSSND